MKNRKEFEFQQDGIDYVLIEISQDKRWALVAKTHGTEEGPTKVWPSDEYLSEIAGCELEFLDMAVDSVYPESIYRVVPDE